MCLTGTFAIEEEVDECPMAIARILIVEDEPPISNLLEMNLTQAGYTCTCCFDGEKAADLIAPGRFDLILLDVMLPKVDGFELLEYIRPMDIPVIFITARIDVPDRVKGLRMGADDYITKPFEVAELLARVESVLRRYRKTERILHVANLEIDTESHQVKKDGEEIELTVKEYALLLLFVRNQNVALYRESIYEQVWEQDYLGDTRTVDLHVQRLRKKLNWENCLQTVYKVGYRLELM